MAKIMQRYIRAKQIAAFLMEGGHLVSDVCEEFRISRDTFQADMKFLATYGYADELKNNQIMYIKAKTALYAELRRRKKMKRG